MDKKRNTKKRNFSKLIRPVAIILGLSMIILLIILGRPAEEITNNENPNPFFMPQLVSAYNNSTDFTLVNNLEFNQFNNNKLYKLGVVSLDSIRKAAIQLGFTYEANDRDFYIWSRVQNPRQIDLVRVLNTEGDLEFFVVDGINVDTIPLEGVYDYVTEFFGLPSNENIEMTIDVISAGNTQTLSMKAYLDGKKIFFRGNDDIAALITLENNKITRGMIRIIPFMNLNNTVDIIPLKNINSLNINKKNYALDVYPENLVSQSNLGGENFVSENFDVRLDSYNEAFYLFYNINDRESYLAPAVEVEGVFQTLTNITGEAILLLINQL